MHKINTQNLCNTATRWKRKDAVYYTYERWGEAEDLGGPAVFLASEASDFVNGLILYVDGDILAYIGKQPG
ncbi:MAG: SDR family oxidoreductase [Gemmiger sp.]|nr:SDR family oxidoreductase [Gemmiger sp.]MDY2694935.1 SDR family oxidoreductase [Gemmiger sp.]